MLGLDLRAARAAWTVALLALLLYVIYLVRVPLFVFVLAVLFAYLLTPLVDLLNRFLPGRTRTPALALAYLIFVGAVVFGGGQLCSRIFTQAKSFTQELPGDIAKWQAGVDSSTTLGRLEADLIGNAQTVMAKDSRGLVAMLPKAGATFLEAGAKFMAVASSLVYVALIPILGFFFLKDGREMRRYLLEAIEEGPKRELLDEILVDMDALLAHYIRALVALSLVSFAAFGVFFAVTGVPYGVMLAAMAGALEIIPMLGPAVAGVAVTLVALIAGAHPLAVVVFAIAFRVVQDYVISPHLMGHGVELHPLLLLFGVFAGAEIAGVAGTFLSVPVLALIRILYLRLRKGRGLAAAAASSA